MDGQRGGWVDGCIDGWRLEQLKQEGGNEGVGQLLIPDGAVTHINPPNRQASTPVHDQSARKA
eukprot:scaffold242893_cov25-Prasinocladus_malaysianus.AAC.1